LKSGSDQGLDEKEFFNWVAPHQPGEVCTGRERFGSIKRPCTEFPSGFRPAESDVQAVEFKAGSSARLEEALGERQLALLRPTGASDKADDRRRNRLRRLLRPCPSNALIEGRPGDYEKLCKTIRRQISFGLKLRKAFIGMSQEDIERVFEVLGSSEGKGSHRNPGRL